MNIWKRKIRENSVPVIDQLGVLSERLKEVVTEIDSITKQMKTDNAQRGSGLKGINHGRT